MSTLQIEEKNARAAYDGADKAGKKLLADLLGSEIFRPKKITDRIKEFSDACEELGIKTHGDAFRILKLPRTLLADIPIEQCDDDFLELQIKVKALNEKWEADYNNGNQRKWFPVFKWNGSAFVFSISNFVYDHADASCGARLALASEELSDYSGRQWIELYNKILKK